MPIPLPETFADITQSWFDAALREGGVVDAEVASIDVVEMQHKGLIGDLAQVNVTYASGSGPASFVVKLPASNPDSRAIGEMLGAYAREVAFYQLVAPHSSNVAVPSCYYLGEDAAAGLWVVVLELIQGDAMSAGATPQQADAAVDALADFHATWWESSTTFGWMPGFDQGGVGGLQPLWLQALPVFVDRYQDVLPEPTAAWVLDFAPRLEAWSAKAANEPLTMVHSDYRLDNMLFSGNQITIIDWQTTMRAPAAMDLSCFIATSLTIDDRRQLEPALIARYLRRLAGHGIEVDPEWFDRSYDENLLWWMGQFGNNLAHLTPDDQTVQAALTEMVSRVYQNALDRNVGRLL